VSGVGIDRVIRAAGETAVLLARIEERQRALGSVAAFAAMAERLGTALAVSMSVPPELSTAVDSSGR